jgi:hypothetical protein
MSSLIVSGAASHPPAQEQKIFMHWVEHQRAQVRSFACRVLMGRHHATQTLQQHNVRMLVCITVGYGTSFRAVRMVGVVLGGAAVLHL